MKRGKEYHSNAFTLNPNFNYLPQSDRYFAYRQPPNYKFNVIGCGINGQEHIVNTLMEGRAEIFGIYDPNPGSIEAARALNAQFNGREPLTLYNSLEQACQEPVVDGLIISTPNHTHINVVREAVKSGKHIFIEKPMATTVQDAFAMWQIADQYEAVFQIGLQYRYKAMYTEALYEALERQSIGSFKLISILEHRIPFLDKVNQWNKFSNLSGGTLVEKCCHYFDLFNLLAQSKPYTVYATGGQAVNFIEFEYDSRPADILDHALVTVVYENGIRANFNLCMFAPLFYEELIICGENGRIKASESHRFHEDNSPSSQLEIARSDNMPSRMMTSTYPKIIAESGHHGATYIEHVNFIDNIEGKKTNSATAEEGFWSIVVGAAAEASVKNGRIICIDEFLLEQGIEI